MLVYVYRKYLRFTQCVIIYELSSYNRSKMAERSGDTRAAGSMVKDNRDGWQAGSYMEAAILK